VPFTAAVAAAILLCAGGIEDYCKAAAAVLAPGGHFVRPGLALCGVLQPTLLLVPFTAAVAAAILLCAGGIEDYCKAAAAVLAPGGHFVVCCGLQGQPFKGQRAQMAAAAAGLVIVRQVTIVTKEGKPPLFAVYVMQAADDVLADTQQQQQEAGAASNADNSSSSSIASVNSSSSSGGSSTLEAQVSAGQLIGCEELFVVRGADGKHTAAWHEAREVMGLPPLRD
jgi:hypothetical protein